jgi:predicted AAA+ superfamily ATPase
MIIKREIASKFSHFEGKLVIVFGPRQAGKTFIIEKELHPTFSLNMDVARDRIAFKQFPEFILGWYKDNVSKLKSKPLVFIDEIHKVTGWRNIIKGTFDKTHQNINYVASGSSAFKLRRQDKGDSLAGRAIWLPLFPVSFREYISSMDNDLVLPDAWHCDSSLIQRARANVPNGKILRNLWDEYVRFGGFAENLIKKDEIFYKQWLEDYLSAMLDRDLKDLHVAKDVERVYQVYQLLLEGLGSTYSLRSISETLDVSPNTVKGDIQAIKQILWGFELPPALGSMVRQIRKEKKFYPIDPCFVAYREPIHDGARFECQVACLLMRGLYSKIFGKTSQYSLGFFRDYNQKETDFVIHRGKEIVLAVECKRRAKAGAENLRAFSKYTPQEMVLLVEEAGVFERINSHTHAVSIEFFAPCLS